jgi:hypothetical protein
MKEELDAMAKIQLRYRDIDPDSGGVTADNLIALIEPQWAPIIIEVLRKADDHDPNREYYLDEPQASVKQLPKPERATKKPGPKADSVIRNNGYTTRFEDLKW